MEKPVFSVVYYSDGKCHHFRCATEKLIEAREMATECFNKFNCPTEIVKSYVKQEVVDTYRPHSVRLFVSNKLEHFYSVEDVLSRIEFLVNTSQSFNFIP